MQFLKTSALLLNSLLLAKVYFEDRFNDEPGSQAFLKRWIQPTNFGKNAEGQPIKLGKFEISNGAFYADEKINRGLKTTENMKFYAATSKLSSTFNNKDKTLVFQFSVKHEQILDCGGGYLKLVSSDVDVDNFNGDSPYYLMFGPDICGNTRRVHCIISYKGKNYLIKENIAPPSDKLTHLYTFIMKPDQKYEILIDNKSVSKGSLFDHWDFLPPQKIPDANAKKPSDWVEEEWIIDVNDKKPANYDSIPEYIIDPNATKPEEWDDEMDGEWTKPKIPNPEYRGEWTPQKIKNPEYKGEWTAPLVDNPDFKPDHRIYEFSKIGYVAFDLWQVSAGTIFDNILLTDDVEYAKRMAKETWEDLKEKEEAVEKAHHEEILKKAAAEAKDAPKLDAEVLDAIAQEEEEELERDEL